MLKFEFLIEATIKFVKNIKKKPSSGMFALSIS